MPVTAVLLLAASLTGFPVLLVGLLMVAFLVAEERIRFQSNREIPASLPDRG